MLSEQRCRRQGMFARIKTDAKPVMQHLKPYKKYHANLINFLAWGLTKTTMMASIIFIYIQTTFHKCHPLMCHPPHCPTRPRCIAMSRLVALPHPTSSHCPAPLCCIALPHLVALPCLALLDKPTMQAFRIFSVAVGGLFTMLSSTTGVLLWLRE